MNLLKGNFSWITSITIGGASLFLTSCSIDEWRSKQVLSQKGLKEVTVSSLKETIVAKDSATASLIIQSGLTKETSLSENGELLLSAIEFNQSRVIHALIQKEVTFPAETQEVAMRSAIQGNQLGIVNALIKNGFPKELAMTDGTTPVAWAVAEKKQAMSRLLLSNDFNPDSKEDNTQPLEIAIKEKSPHWLIDHLVTSGANTNFLTKDEQAPILHEVILNSSHEALPPLLKADTDLNLLDKEGKTALFKAISTGELVKVEQLVLHGAEYQRIDEDQRNYLQLTQIFADSPKLTQYLLDKDLDPHHKNSEGKNALDLALEYKRLEAAKTLITNKAVTTSGTFDRLYNSGNREAIGIMIKAGLVDPNSSLSTGDSLIIDSIKQGNPEMVDTLLRQGADPNLRAVDNEPPLSYAVALQDLEICKLLLERGAEVDAPFQTPSAERFKEIVKTEGRIKWFIDRDSGITPIMMACDQGNLDLVILLRENGASNKGSKKYRFWPGNFAAHLSYTDVVQYMVGAEPGSRERTVTVDLSSQRATVYNADKETVMSFRISSGKRGNRTRTGEFVVTNKKRNHVSTIYDSSMPYFQRLSYSDFGFHTGYVPGYPASHGCIRCPNSYAYKLYNYLKVGDVVNIQQ